jgi:hypothetical protein
METLILNSLELSPQLKKAVEADISGLDIIHGELKNLMYEVETKLSVALLGEGYEYLEGRLDAFVEVYKLTYQLSFAIGDKNGSTN